MPPRPLSSLLVRVHVVLGVACSEPAPVPPAPTPAPEDAPAVEVTAPPPPEASAPEAPPPPAPVAAPPPPPAPAPPPPRPRPVADPVQDPRLLPVDVHTTAPTCGPCCHGHCPDETTPILPPDLR